VKWWNRWPLVAVTGAAVGLAGCGVQTLSYAPPPAVTAPAVTLGPTLPANLPSVTEPAVPGSTTTLPNPIGPGGASLNGTVLGSAGPAAGAVVEVDRLVGGQVTSARATTAADGSWTIAGILGGRYRVRAWQQPDLDLVDPQIFFLAGTESHALTLQLTAFSGPDVAASIAPATPVAGEVDNLLLQVTNPVVGSDGVVRPVAAAGVSVTLVDGPLWSVDNGNPLTSGADGTVLFQVTCQGSGDIPLSAQAGSGAPVPLTVPACLPPPTTTTTPPTTVAPCPSPTVPQSDTTSTVAAPTSTEPTPATTSPSGLC
jgi:hypothetical protein